jgi:hypothetical protein
VEQNRLQHIKLFIIIFIIFYPFKKYGLKR